MKPNISNWIVILTTIIFLVGFFVMFTNKNITEYDPFSYEGFEGTMDECPDMLIQQGNEISLVSKNQKVMTFHSLDDYNKFHEEQKANGKDCPLLVLKQENNAQGQEVYRMYRNPTDALPLFPPSSKQGPIFPPPFSLEKSQDTYAGFDAYNMTNGVYTNLDKLHDKTSETPESENAMDNNWGGVEVTQRAVDEGKYKENEVVKISYPNPKFTGTPL